MELGHDVRHRLRWAPLSSQRHSKTLCPCWRRVNAAMALPFPDILPSFRLSDAGEAAFTTLSPRAETTTALDRKRRKASVRPRLGGITPSLGERSRQKGA